MTKIKLTDNLSLSQIIRGFWRLDTWELSTDELIDKIYDGSVDKLFAALLGRKKLSMEQIKNLKQIVSELE